MSRILVLSNKREITSNILLKMTIFDSKSIVLIASVEYGLPEPSHFSIVESVVDSENLQEGDMLVRLLVLSADPFLRASIKSGGFNHAGEVMSGFVAGKVLASKNAKRVEGDLFGSKLPISTVQIVTADALSRTDSWKLTELVDEEHISYGIGILGMPGSTAYGGLLGILNPKIGETIFISAASGAVSGLVGQLAKQIFNCKVIGSCGGAEKCTLIKDKFGFDYAIDYKTVHNAGELVAKLKEVAPEDLIF